MKVNISLVGGQPFPVFAQALDAKPDILVLIHSEKTKPEAENIKKSLRNKFENAKIELENVDADNLKKAESRIRDIFEKYAIPENNLILNITGGIKPWALQLYHLSLPDEHIKCVFIHQNNKVWDMKSLESHICNHDNITIDDLFELHGVTGAYNEFNQSDDELSDTIEELYKADSNALHKIVFDYLKEDKKLKGVMAREGKLFIKVNNNNDFECRISPDNKLYHICSPSANNLLINYGWFEHKVAKLLSKWHDAKRVLVNAKINFDKTYNTANEIDIIVETKSGKYLFVECKTSVYDSTDIDKFNNAVKNYGGLGAKCIFVTYHTMKKSPQKKCEKSKIKPFAYNVICRDDISQDKFFNELDRELATSNDR